MSKVSLEVNFLEATPDPTMIKSADGTYLFINVAFERAFGVERSNIIGRKAGELWGKYLTDNAARTDAEILSTGSAISYEISFEAPDGEIKDLLVNKFPMKDDDGAQLIGVTYADITNRKKAERILAESEERYALASHEVGIWDWNMDTGEVYISPAFRRLLGLQPVSKSKTTSAELRKLYHPDDFAAHEKRLQDHLNNQHRPYKSVHRFRNADGTYRWYRAVGTATSSTNGKPTRVIGMLTDIDDEKRMTEALRLSEARISTLLDNSPSSIYFKDADLQLVVANRKYLEMYGLEADTAYGKNSVELFGPDPGQDFLAHDKEVLDKNTLISREETLNARELLTIKFPIVDSDGALAGVGGIEIDITERKEVERAYKNARDDAEAANRAKSAFLANMSHELRTPLNSVIGFSDSLLAGTLGELENEKHREYISIINSAGSYLLELINDILDLSRIESGFVELDETTFDVQPIITSAIIFSQDRHSEKPVQIQNLTPDNVPHVRGDQRQLRQVLINLITNAIKFTPPDGQIRVSCEITADGALAIAVSDTGMGISPDDIERVKSPFVQVADSMTRQHEGTGLGLAITRSIAELHDAEFKIESTIGEGTTVTFVLPADRVAP